MFLSQIVYGFVYAIASIVSDSNREFIQSHNQLNLSYELGETPFINVSFVNGISNKNTNNEYYMSSMNTDMKLITESQKESVDWRQEGAVSSVKNQLDCGGCWSFSAAGAIEGEYFIKHHTLYNFSEQELIDCSAYLGNKGCDGGTMDNAFQYTVDHGLCLYENYPFEDKNGYCKNTTCGRKYSISTYYDVPRDNIDQLEKAVSKQPISVAIQANLRTFQLYKRGIYSDPDCGTLLDHGVLLIGYGYDTEYELDYWILKNSWGETWGEDGYMRLVKKDTDTHGLCGIAMDPSYPVIRVWN